MSVTFLSEHESGTRGNELQISSVCNARCVFCSNYNNPFDIKRLGYRDFEEIKKTIPTLRPEKYGYIALRNFRKISEGESVLHPRFFEILELIRKDFPSFPIVIDTNGTQFTEEFILRMTQFLPMRIYISYHSHNVEYWKKIFSLKEKNYSVATNSFDMLVKHGFDVVGCITACPSIVGYNDLDDTVAFLSKYVKNIEVNAVTWTKKTPPELVHDLTSDFEELHNFLNDMAKKHNCHISLDPDVVGELLFYPDFVIKKFNARGYKNIFWLMSECSFKRACVILKNAEESENHHPRMVKNYTYGGNVIVSGLLMVDDYRKEILNILKEGLSPDLILLPASPFDKFGCDLCGESYKNLSSEFNIPVLLINDIALGEEGYAGEVKKHNLKDLPLQTYSKDFYTDAFKIGRIAKSES